MNCEWVDKSARPLVCKVCERACDSCKTDDARRKCPGPSGPSQLQRVKNFAKAAVKHERAGRPKVRQEIVDQRLAICQAPCPFYSPDRKVCLHKQCGCNVGNEKKYLNKLAWADQKCPDGRWPAV